MPCTQPAALVKPTFQTIRVTRPSPVPTAKSRGFRNLTNSMLAVSVQIPFHFSICRRLTPLPPNSATAGVHLCSSLSSRKLRLFRRLGTWFLSRPTPSSSSLLLSYFFVETLNYQCSCAEQQGGAGQRCR